MAGGSTEVSKIVKSIPSGFQKSTGRKPPSTIMHCPHKSSPSFNVEHQDHSTHDLTIFTGQSQSSDSICESAVSESSLPLTAQIIASVYGNWSPLIIISSENHKFGLRGSQATISSLDSSQYSVQH